MVSTKLASSAFDTLAGYLFWEQNPLPAVANQLSGIYPTVSNTTLRMSTEDQSSGSLSDAGNNFPCNRQSSLQM